MVPLIYFPTMSERISIAAAADSERSMDPDLHSGSRSRKRKMAHKKN
jgi:hypothetical protein